MRVSGHCVTALRSDDSSLADSGGGGLTEEWAWRPEQLSAKPRHPSHNVENDDELDEFRALEAQVSLKQSLSPF